MLGYRQELFTSRFELPNKVEDEGDQEGEHREDYHEVEVVDE